MANAPVERVESRDAAVDRLVALIREAEHVVMLYTDARTYERVSDALVAARSRDVLVLLVVTAAAESPAEDLVDSFAETASVARTRHLESVGPTGCVVDTRQGLVAHETRDGTLLDGALAFDHLPLRSIVAMVFYVLFLDGTDEQYTAPPRPLPATYDDFYHAVVDATLYLTEGREVWADIEVVPANTGAADPEVTTVSGLVATARQNFITPRTNAVFGETTLVVRTGDDRVTVGGPGAFMEDYLARSTRLRETPR